jgi:hypothetical protein
LALDQVVLWCAGIGTELAIIVLLFLRRTYKMFPVFTACIAWGLCTDVGYYTVAHFYPADYFRVYLVGMTIESLLEFGVLVELSWSILRPLRSALPRGAIVVVALVIGIICALIWPFAQSASFSHYGPESRLLIHMEQTFAIMRVLFFLVLAACSQWLSISWRDRELQIATGLGFYSLVSVAVSIIQASQTVGATYIHLNQIIAVSYVCSLVYWAFSFAAKEAPRREFTPQMQSFLLAVAGSARSTRLGLTDSRAKNRRRGED